MSGEKLLYIKLPCYEQQVSVVFSPLVFLAEESQTSNFEAKLATVFGAKRIERLTCALMGPCVLVGPRFLV